MEEFKGLFELQREYDGDEDDVLRALVNMVDERDERIQTLERRLAEVDPPMLCATCVQPLVGPYIMYRGAVYCCRTCVVAAHSDAPYDRGPNADAQN